MQVLFIYIKEFKKLNDRSWIEYLDQIEALKILHF
jgi:hypothetical protein